MPSDLDVHRFVLRLRRESDRQARRLGGTHLTQHRAIEYARRTADCLQELSHLLARQGQPVPVAAQIIEAADTAEDIEILILLDDRQIGHFWIQPRHWIFRFNMQWRSRITFASALRNLSALVARKEAYRQLLLRRQAPILQMLREEAAGWRRPDKALIRTGYEPIIGWELRRDSMRCLIDAGQASYAVTTYGDRYCWGASFYPPARTLISTDEMIRHIRREMTG